MLPGQRGARGPHRDGLGGTPGSGAQVPAAVQAAERLSLAADPPSDLERLPQVLRGVLHSPGLQVQERHPYQQPGQVPQVARVAGPGQPARAAALGGAQVASQGQRARQDVVA